MTITNLADLIAQVESAGDPYAIRYEPNWTFTTPATLAAAVRVHRCSTETARVLLSCSWGLYQVMGSVIYDLSAPGTEPNLLKDFVSDTTLQTRYFERFNSVFCGTATLADIVHETETGLHFCERYNGDGPAYMARCQAVLKAQA